MANKTPEFTKNDVIRLHVLGDTNAEIHRIAGTSTGNVSNIINGFKNEIDEGSYQSMMELTNLCKTNDIRPSEALEGLATRALLKKNKIGQDGFERFVQAHSKFPDIADPSNLADCSLMLYKLASQTDMNIEEIPAHHDSLLGESEKLESEIKSQQKKLQDLKLQTDEGLKKRDVNQSMLDRFDSVWNSLCKLGLDADDHENFAKMISKAKSSGYNISEIAKHLSNEKSSEAQMAENKETIEKQETAIKRGEEIKKSYVDELDSLKNKIDDYNEKYKTEKTAINYLKELSKQGIPYARIEELENAIAKCDSEFPEFEKNIKSLGDVIAKTDDARDEYDKLKSDIAIKRGEKNALDKTVLEKRSQSETLDKEISKVMSTVTCDLAKEIKTIAMKTENSLEYHDAGARSRTDNLLKNFDDDLKAILQNIQDTIKKSLLTYNVEAKFSFLEPLYHIFTESKGEKTKVCLSMVNLLTGLEPWLKNSQAGYQLISRTRLLKSAFQELLEKQAIAS